jgi:hypothetical protein
LSSPALPDQYCAYCLATFPRSLSLIQLRLAIEAHLGAVRAVAAAAAAAAADGAADRSSSGGGANGIN